MQLLTVGYGKWPTKTRWLALVAALRRARVATLVDIRHSPCSSSSDPQSSYGPRPWHLGAEPGIDALLRDEGIEYRWLVELGNPQKTDPRMRVMRAHLADRRGHWPVHRGLDVLRTLVVDAGERCCLMCACKSYEACHRKLVAEAFRERLRPLPLELVELPAR